MTWQRRIQEATRAPAVILHRTREQCDRQPDCLFCYVRVTVALIRYNRQIRQLRKEAFNLDELEMIHAAINLEVTP